MKLRVSAWAIRNPLPIALLFVALTLLGWMSYTRLPIKEYPNIAFPLVQVSVSQSGSAPSEVENQISRPIEDALAGIANVKHITTYVSLGLSNTDVEFNLGTDMQKATDDVRTAVDRTRVQLPPGIDPPLVQRVDVDSNSILTYALSSPRLSPVQLSWFVDNTVSRFLQGLPGVAQVSRDGGQDREINVTLDPARMAAFGVTAPQVNAALYAYNVDETGGRADIGGREQTVRVLGQAASVDALRSLTIPANGRYVSLSDIAEIGDGQSEPRAFALLNDRPVVGFDVRKTRDASDISTERVVKAAIEKLKAQHPEVTFTQILSTVDETRESYTATVHVLLEGMNSRRPCGLRVPEELARHGDRRRRHAAIAAAHLQCATGLRLQPQHHHSAVSDAGHRHPGGRRHRGDRKHREAHRAGGEPVSRVLDRRRFDRAGGAGDHGHYRRGVHAGVVHGRCVGAVLQGVRPDGRRRSNLLPDRRTPAHPTPGGLLPEAESSRQAGAPAWRGSTAAR